jgi:peptide/nickel transport system permease protein
MRLLYKKWKKSFFGKLGTLIVFVFLFCAIWGPAISPRNPEAMSLATRLAPPVWVSPGGSWKHPLGTDMMGRDVLSRVICGTRNSMMVGLFSSFIALLIGVSLGMISGYIGGFVDVVVMRVVDIMLAIPAVMLAVVIVAIIGPYPISIIIAMGITMWSEYAKVIRSRILVLREEPFVLAAKTMGATNKKIILRHIFPNIFYIIIVIFTLQIGLIILWSAGLSFIGLGGATLSWGWDVAAGRVYLARAWWLSTIPGLAIFFCVLGCNLFGDWLRDALDPGVKKFV